MDEAAYIKSSGSGQGENQPLKKPFFLLLKSSFFLMSFL